MIVTVGMLVPSRDFITIKNSQHSKLLQHTGRLKTNTGNVP